MRSALVNLVRCILHNTNYLGGVSFGWHIDVNHSPLGRTQTKSLLHLASLPFSRLNGAAYSSTSNPGLSGTGSHPLSTGALYPTGRLDCPLLTALSKSHSRCKPDLPPGAGCLAHNYRLLASAEIWHYHGSKGN